MSGVHRPEILLSDIDNAEWAMKSVRVKLNEMGREIYKMRNGEELDLRYHFHKYERLNFNGPEYSGEKGPHWGVGTPIISIAYFWSYQGGGDADYVTFPQSYLCQDWRAVEADRLAEERSEQDKKSASDRAGKEAAHEARDRETYVRLQAKFGKDGAS